MKSTVVHIWGLAIDGKVFRQNATFRSLSRTGAQIEGVVREVRVRETIALQYEQKRARVVVSSIDSRDRNNIILRVALIADGECPWEALLERSKIEKKDDNRRRFKRHAVEMPVELRDGSSEISVRVLATDVCGNGCYLQTMATAPVGTVFLASFWYADMRLTCECTVRTCDPGLGMGIEFTGLDQEARTRLQHWLEVSHAPSIVVVVAAGNDGRDNSAGTNGYGTITAPGNDPYVITVGAMNAKGTPDRADDTMTSYSSKGPTAIDHIAKPDIVAPGNAVVSLQASGATLVKQNPSNRPALSTYETGKGDLSKPSDAYFVLSGTSMATPMVSAAAALLIQQHPSLTPDQIKARLMKTAYKNLPPSITIVSGGQTLVEQADVFTVGAGYLESSDCTLGL